MEQVGRSRSGASDSSVVKDTPGASSQGGRQALGLVHDPTPNLPSQSPQCGVRNVSHKPPGGLGTAQEARTRARATVAYGGHLTFGTVCPSCSGSCSLGGEFQEPSGPLMPIKPQLH